MGKKEQEEQIKKLEDWMGFFTELGEESNRGRVIIAAAWLDAHLGQLIRNKLIDSDYVWTNLLDPLHTAKPLSNFGARIMMAYALGLIGVEERRNLKQIQWIRNRFAHDLHGLDYDDPDISKFLGKLTIVQKAIDVFPIPDTPHSRILLAIVLLGTRLENKAIEAEANRLSEQSPENYVELVEGPPLPEHASTIRLRQLLNQNQ